jgi:hypothetical protein
MPSNDKSDDKERISKKVRDRASGQVISHSLILKSIDTNLLESLKPDSRLLVDINRAEGTFTLRVFAKEGESPTLMDAEILF